MSKIFSRSNIISIFSIFVISIFPSVFLYLQNFGTAYFWEAMYIATIFVAISVAFLIISLLFTRSLIKSALMTCIFALLFANYHLVERAVRFIAPSIRPWHLIPIIFFVLFHICIVIREKANEKIIETITLFFGMAFSVMILINVVTAAPQMISRFSDIRNESSTRIDVTGAGQATLHPNIYYFIFDEYASFESIERHFGYDNSAFAEFLKSHGFTVSRDSFSSWTNTNRIIANLMALDYIWVPPYGDTAQLLLEWADNEMFNVLEAHGYQIKGLGATPRYFGLDGTRVASATVDGLSFSNILLRNSMLGIFVSIEDVFTLRAQEVIEIRDYFRNFEPELGNTFILSYAISPHPPFIFDRYGNMHRDMILINDNANPNAYLEQFIFITRIMEEIAENIIRVDPNSIIIFQSDHGARILFDRDTGENLIPQRDQLHILNAVYFMGEPLNIHGQSKVNTMRIILSKVLGLDLPIVPVP